MIDVSWHSPQVWQTDRQTDRQNSHMQCPSRSSIISKTVNISSNCFSPSGRSAVFPYQTLWPIFGRDHLMGAWNAGRVWKKSRISTNMSPYLRNDTSCSYYETPIECGLSKVTISNDLEWLSKISNDTAVYSRTDVPLVNGDRVARLVWVSRSTLFSLFSASFQMCL